MGKVIIGWKLVLEFLSLVVGLSCLDKPVFWHKKSVLIPTLKYFPLLRPELSEFGCEFCHCYSSPRCVMEYICLHRGWCMISQPLYTHLNCWLQSWNHHSQCSPNMPEDPYQLHWSPALMSCSETVIQNIFLCSHRARCLGMSTPHAVSGQLMCSATCTLLAGGIYTPARTNEVNLQGK